MAYQRSTSSNASSGAASRVSVRNLICSSDSSPVREPISKPPLPQLPLLPSPSVVLGGGIPFKLPGVHTLLTSTTVRPSSPGIRKRGASSGKGKRLWSAYEDNLLRNLAGPNPQNWNVISHQLPERTGKQCRERWLNHLRPDIVKGQWSEREDAIILKEQRMRGNRWSEIARMLPGRSDNAVKNRYNATLKRRYSS